MHFSAGRFEGAMVRRAVRDRVISGVVAGILVVCWLGWVWVPGSGVVAVGLSAAMAVRKMHIDPICLVCGRWWIEMSIMHRLVGASRLCHGRGACVAGR